MFVRALCTGLEAILAEVAIAAREVSQVAARKAGANQLSFKTIPDFTSNNRHADEAIERRADRFLGGGNTLGNAAPIPASA